MITSLKVISRWRKRLNEGGGGLSSMIAHSTKPKNVRQPETRGEIVARIWENSTDNCQEAISLTFSSIPTAPKLIHLLNTTTGHCKMSLLIQTLIPYMTKGSFGEN